MHCFILKKWLHPHQNSFVSMRISSRISMYTCALIVEVKIAISSGSLNDMLFYIMDDLENLLVSIIFICFIWMVSNKSFSIWKMQILDSPLNIIFILSSTYHDCLSLDHFDLIFFCLHFSVEFYWAFLYVNYIPFRWFLTVLSQTLFQPICLVVYCLFSRHSALNFLC